MHATTKKTPPVPHETSTEDLTARQEVDLSQEAPKKTEKPAGSQSQRQQHGDRSEDQHNKDVLQQLQQKFDALNDQHLRLAAEFDNYKRRSAQQMQQQLQYANEPLARELLPCLDHLQQALQMGKQALSNADHPSFNTLLDGIDMVQKQLLEALQRFGVSCLQPVGEPFDPNQHEAVSQQEDEQSPPGTVLQQLQAGYMLHERLLRPARVVVAKAKESQKA